MNWRAADSSTASASFSSRATASSLSPTPSGTCSWRWRRPCTITPSGSTSTGTVVTATTTPSSSTRDQQCVHGDDDNVYHKCDHKIVYAFLQRQRATGFLFFSPVFPRVKEKAIFKTVFYPIKKKNKKKTFERRRSSDVSGFFLFFFFFLITSAHPKPIPGFHSRIFYQLHIPGDGGFRTVQSAIEVLMLTCRVLNCNCIFFRCF